MSVRISQLWTVIGTLLVCVTADVTIPGHQRQVTQTLRELLGRWYYPIQLGGILTDTQAALCAAHSALALTTQDTWGYTMWDAHGKLPDGYGAGATEARGHDGLCRSVEAQFSGPLSAHLYRYRDDLQSFNTSYHHLVKSLQGHRNTSFRGKYCLVNIRSENQSDEKPAVGGSSQLLSLMAEQFEHSYASCVPDSCTGLLLQESIGNQDDTNGTVTVICEGDEDLNTISYGDYAFCLLTVGLITLVISAWALESWSPCDSKEHSKCPYCTPGLRLLRCFSPVENGKRLLSMSCSASGQNFKSLDGLRSISMIWVVLAHRYMFFLLSVSNPQDILKHRNSWEYWWVFNAYPSVDTFLFISAFLLSVFLKDRVKKFSLTGFYLTRYFRLIPAMVYVMLGCMTVLKHMGSNLVWHRIYEGLFGRPCQKYAWANLFFINNLLDSDQMCMGHLWSLAAEWQLYLITPLILVPLYKWRHPVLKMLPLLCTTALSIIIPAVITILRNLPTTASFPDLMSSTVYYNYYYMVPWCRAGPYCVGILAGWGYHWLNDTKPTIKKEYLVMGSILSTIIILMVLLGPSLLSGQGVYWAAFYTSLARPLWAVAIAYFVLCTSIGKKGLISWVCEWPIWGPLCRVSYCMFLVSLPLQSWAAARPQKMHYDSITAGYLVAGDLVLSYMVGMAIVLLVEAPAARILNLLLLGKLHGKGSKPTTIEKVKNAEVIGENNQLDNANKAIEQAERKIEDEIPKTESIVTDMKYYDEPSIHKQLDEKTEIKEKQLCRQRRKVGISGVPGMSDNTVSTSTYKTESMVTDMKNDDEPSIYKQLYEKTDIKEKQQCRQRRKVGVSGVPGMSDNTIYTSTSKTESMVTDMKNDDEPSIYKQLDEKTDIKEKQLCRQRRKVGISGVPGMSDNTISTSTYKTESMVTDMKNDDEPSIYKQLDEKTVIKEKQLCRQRRRVGISGVAGMSDNTISTSTSDSQQVKDVVRPEASQCRRQRKVGISGMSEMSENNISIITSNSQEVKDVVRPEASQCRPRRRVGVTEMPSLLTMIHAQTDSTNDFDHDKIHPEPLDTIKEKLSIDSSPDAAEIAALIKKHSSSSYNQDNMLPVEIQIPQATSLKRRRHSLPVRRNSLPWSPLDFIGMSNCGGSTTIRTRI